MPNVGDRTEDSIIWVPGETTGHDYTGKSIPVRASGAVLTSETASEIYADAAVKVLHDRLVASGVI